jgi:hypothetical protein
LLVLWLEAVAQRFFCWPLGKTVVHDLSRFQCILQAAAHLQQIKCLAHTSRSTQCCTTWVEIVEGLQSTGKAFFCKT